MQCPAGRPNSRFGTMYRDRTGCPFHKTELPSSSSILVRFAPLTNCAINSTTTVVAMARDSRDISLPTISFPRSFFVDADATLVPRLGMPLSETERPSRTSCSVYGDCVSTTDRQGHFRISIYQENVRELVDSHAKQSPRHLGMAFAKFIDCLSATALFPVR